VEDAVSDGAAIRSIVGIDPWREGAPDATTVLKFRRLLEDDNLTQALFERINKHLTDKGLLMRGGTMVDATIIAAPPSTKNKDHARDPEMHQTKKGAEWHFGMKAHTGCDVESGLVHSLSTTVANESDVAHAHEVLHEQPEFDTSGVKELTRALGRVKAQVRARLEHPYHAVKNLFRHK
jgi:IS5 family transposase